MRVIGSILSVVSLVMVIIGGCGLDSEKIIMPIVLIFIGLFIGIIALCLLDEDEYGDTYEKK